MVTLAPNTVVATADSVPVCVDYLCYMQPTVLGVGSTWVGTHHWRCLLCTVRCWFFQWECVRVLLPYNCWSTCVWCLLWQLFCDWSLDCWLCCVVTIQAPHHPSDQETSHPVVMSLMTQLSVFIFFNPYMHRGILIVISSMQGWPMSVVTPLVVFRYPVIFWMCPWRVSSIHMLSVHCVCSMSLCTCACSTELQQSSWKILIKGPQYHMAPTFQGALLLQISLSKDFAEIFFTNGESQVKWRTGSMQDTMQDSGYHVENV